MIVFASPASVPPQDPPTLCYVATGSRDKTVKVWRISSDEGRLGCDLVRTFSHHVHYVNAITYIPPFGDFPEGLLLSGGSDKLIYGFSPNLCGTDSDEPIFTLVGHEANITSLYATVDDLSVTLYSGSWDHTIREWQNWQCTKTLQGHTQAVWCLTMLSNGVLASGTFNSIFIYILGSADKTIRLWQDGICTRVLNGHSDAVRDLCRLPLTGFVSCSNDATLRLWSDQGDCLRVISDAHSSFIYTLSVLPDYRIVSAGEDRQVRLVSASEQTPAQHLPYPGLSIWTATHYNDVIVLAGSDGAFRMYSENEAYWHPDREAFHAQCAENVSSVDVLSKAHGPEALQTRQGTKEGEILLIKQPSGQVMAYAWQQSVWSPVGHVIDSDTAAPPGKQLNPADNLYYDNVFQIDVREGQPTLPLGYNYGDNPYAVAESFLAQHDLPSSYTEQIVQFILKNTESTLEIVKLTQINWPALTSALHGFNDGTLISKLELDTLIEAMKSDSSNVDDTLFETMITYWPIDKLFPVLDLYRLRVLHTTNIVPLQRLLDEDWHDPIKLAKALIRVLVNLATQPSYILANTDLYVSLAKKCKPHVPPSAWQPLVQNFGALVQRHPHLAVHLDAIY